MVFYLALAKVMFTTQFQQVYWFLLHPINLSHPMVSVCVFSISTKGLDNIIYTFHIIQAMAFAILRLKHLNIYVTCNAPLPYTHNMVTLTFSQVLA